MTDIEQWELEREALTRRIENAKAERLERQARAVFRKLGEDERLAVMEIIDQALMSLKPTDPRRAAAFVERMVVLVKVTEPEPEP